MVHMVLVLDLNTQTKSGFCRPDGDTNETLKLTEVIFGDKKLLEIIYLRFKQFFQLISVRWNLIDRVIPENFCSAIKP